MTSSERRSGTERLREFLKKRGIALREAAKGIKVSHPAIVQWLDGTAKPSAPHREAIDRWSDGEVPAESWLEPHEENRLNEIVPWAPAEAEAADETAPPFPSDGPPANGGTGHAA